MDLCGLKAIHTAERSTLYPRPSRHEFVGPCGHELRWLALPEARQCAQGWAAGWG